jgi:hypothetical protein
LGEVWIVILGFEIQERVPRYRTVTAAKMFTPFRARDIRPSFLGELLYNTSGSRHRLNDVPSLASSSRTMIVTA